MLPIGGMGVPGINQPSNNLNPLQDVDVVTQKSAENQPLPPTTRSDTGNQTSNDTAQQNTGSKDNSAVTAGSSNVITAPSKADSSEPAQDPKSFTVFVSDTESNSVRSVVEFKLSEPSSEQLEQETRTASLEAERAYQSQSFVEKLTDDLSKSVLNEQSIAAAQTSGRPNAEQVAVAQLAPDL